MSKPIDPLSTPKPAQHTFEKGFVTPTTVDQQQQQHSASQSQAESSNSTLAPTSATAESSMSDSQAPVQAYAKLEGPEFCYYVRTLEVALGRHPSSVADSVDIDLGDSKAVSRRHAKIYYNFMNQNFELQVLGKNGCLVDDEYYAKGQSVPLRHKMVIQIGDTEFTFLLPKAAMPAQAPYAGDAPAQPSKLMHAPPLDMPAQGAHHYPHAGHPHYTPLQPPPHAGYPVNAITPQRLNLYPTSDAATRSSHGPPGYPGQPMYGSHSRHSPDEHMGPIARDHEPPAPLSFGDMRSDSRAYQDGSRPYSGDASDHTRRSDSYVSQDSHAQHHAGRQPPISSSGALLPPPPPPQPRPAASGRGQHTPQGSTAAAEVRILPATERPASSDAQTANNFAKPTYSYASLIAQAINSTSGAKITLNGIYTYIQANYPYYKHAQNGWQNSIRHNLSLNKAFVRVQRASNEPGKGSYWAIDDAYKGQFANGVYKRTRRTKKAMEQEREQDRKHARAEPKRGAAHTPIAPRTRSVAGEKRASPDDDDIDYEEAAAPANGARQRTGHLSKRLSVGAQSTGEDTVGYMSSAQSNNGDSNPNSLPGSPRNPSESGNDQSPEHRAPPPASSTRSKAGSAKPVTGSYAAPASITLPSSSRPSQPRPQRSAAR